MVRSFGIVLAAAGLLVAPAGASDTSEPDDPAPATTVAENPFLPEDTDVNLTDCVSAVPRPECGSKERGGWRQYVVFGAVAGGLALIGTRVVTQMNRRRSGLGGAQESQGLGGAQESHDSDGGASP